MGRFTGKVYDILKCRIEKYNIKSNNPSLSKKLFNTSGTKNPSILDTVIEVLWL